MADCAPLLDEELSSFVFNYLTENSGSQYGEEEVCSDRLDSDFPDIDLSQLDPSDFDSVNCLSELQWCSDQEAHASPASIHCSSADQLFQIEEENAALLAALTDSLDGMVDAEVGGLSVFPGLEEEPDSDQDSLPLNQDFNQTLDSEDPSLLKKLLLTPPNVPTGVDTNKDGIHSHRYSNRSQRLVKPLVKIDLPLERKPRVVRPSGRLCTELHRHLTTSGHRGNQDTAAPVSEDDEEEEEEEESESEEEEEDDSSSSEIDAASAEPQPQVDPPKPQFSSEKELQSVVDLITYMHTYCLPSRKQHGGWERRDRDAQKNRSRAQTSTQTNSHTRVVLVATPGTSLSTGHASGTANANANPKRIPFARRREVKANSLLRELLQQTSSYDVSKPYRLHSPPYVQSSSPNRGASATTTQAKTAPSSSSTAAPKADSSSPDRSSSSTDISQDVVLEDSGSFSVRRSRRLASFPSRFAKRHRPARPIAVEKREDRSEGKLTVKLTQAPETSAAETVLTATDSSTMATEPTKPCCHSEKRACLCLPLNPKSTGESQYSTKPFEPTLSVDLCGTAGLTPPTTPPHKSVEDELFKPTDSNKTTTTGTGSEGGGGGGDSINPASNSSSNNNNNSSPSTAVPKPSSWLRGAPNRKQPEQTELYAQLRRMGQVGEETQRSFGDHDYCALSLGESRKRSAAILGAMLQAQTGKEEAMSTTESADEEASAETKAQEEDISADEEPRSEPQNQDECVEASPSPASECQSSTPPASEEETERSEPRSPSPPLHVCPDSPASKTDSSENSEVCVDEAERKESVSDEDNCQVFYIHNLPSSVTQNMLRKRFQVFGKAEDCKVIICNEERCGVIKIRQSGGQRHRRETVFNSAPAGLRRLTRKRYIDLDEAGPGPVKSKYDALDFDTLLKEAQKSLHR
ncbi:peroxisome proliferator-activated receptor gamma coactivator 1-beta isoform X2 [Boleophthalmus pectinirostris]|uniref:peroxisome proliferator-activated receptor gamma coactivator 1-beta isoform X2 n=1 Tax=Boleophthalmus pectinirostris TaxID=150288 RepID=UPI00242FC70D|nr:peroxisome proliferator-activated receptor gamma coactivator 1-beta isoform X2 [Boleophthalmus pectinirostris]